MPKRICESGSGFSNYVPCKNLAMSRASCSVTKWIVTFSVLWRKHERSCVKESITLEMGEMELSDREDIPLCTLEVVCVARLLLSLDT